MTGNGKNKWQFPWLYKRSFLVALFIICIGIILEMLRGGRGISPPAFPFNLLIIFFFLIFSFLFYKYFNSSPFIRWISGIYAAVSSVTIVAVLTLIGSLIPQNDSYSDILRITGLSHMTVSCEYALAFFYLIFVLTMVLIRRILNFRWQSLSFILNHSGLLMILLAGFMGSGDIRDYNFCCYLDKPSVKGFDRSAKAHSIPFSIQLLKFQMEEFPSHLIFFNGRSGKIINQGKDFQYEIKIGGKFGFRQYEIVVTQFYENSLYNGNEFFLSTDTGTFPAANIEITNQLTKEKLGGWISCGRKKYSPVFIKIDDECSVTMSKPEPRSFESCLKIRGENGEINNILTTVNHPGEYKGWRLYQAGYDAGSGKFSEYSIIEAVYDPWLSVIYTGIIMLIAGSVLLLFSSAKFKDIKANDPD